MTIASFYAPNTSQIAFLDRAFQSLTEFSEGALILAWDCNYISDIKYDRSHIPTAVTILKERSFTALQKLLGQYDLVDTLRHLYPMVKDYTFYSACHKVHTRIDLILTSKTTAIHVLKADIGVKSISDHSWISCDLTLGEAAASDKRWSLNKTLLQLDSVKEKIA